jgi:hypothetical protein
MCLIHFCLLCSMQPKDDNPYRIGRKTPTCAPGTMVTMSHEREEFPAVMGLRRRGQVPGDRLRSPCRSCTARPLVAVGSGMLEKRDTLPAKARHAIK